MNDLTAFQQRMIEVLQGAPNNMEEITTLAWRLKSSRLAVYSSAMSLHRKGILCVWRRGQFSGHHRNQFEPLMVGQGENFPKIPDDLHK